MECLSLIIGRPLREKCPVFPVEISNFKTMDETLTDNVIDSSGKII